MALFGLFGKKDNKPAPAEKKAPADTSAAGARAPVTPVAKPDPAAPVRAQRRDPAVANATAKKIDAIESEMSSEFSATRLQAGHTRPGPSAEAQLASKAAQASNLHTRPGPQHSFESTLPSIGMSTEFLLGPQGKNTDIVIIGTEAAQVIEEAAILYASNQGAMTEQVLRAAIDGNMMGEQVSKAWLMLFDLYQFTGRQRDFDALSIDYASLFETSPPSWRSNDEQAAPAPDKQGVAGAGAVPSVAFVGKLDGNIIRLLERVQKLAETSPTLRLEFARVLEVDPIGCGLLLRILKRLQATERDLVLVGARELAEKIRKILQVGRRDETEAPWLLLLEILRLLNAEREFEEASIDYCVTFEVSPPAFQAPRNKVTTAEAGAENPAALTYVLPAIIEGKTEQLISGVAAFANSHDPALVDCARLQRIDFNAAGELLSSLAPIVAEGRVIEFIEVNHLVAALFDVIGLKDIARIVVRKG
ncbi:hypothetical protein [Lacisediminimonas sp.]|uniref:STAS domain-containing protein n=1 Tax=Lacisediminimonas sp. TaxID=3060582 RepID=UPI0027157B7A|nr:hypothetical protein [Lacisediminimonas sp.]MDO8299022.1 hypothetical protein [Lacisediminimonas sp.]